MSQQVSRKSATGTGWIVAGVIVLVLGCAAFVRALTALNDPTSAAGSFVSAVIVLLGGIALLVVGLRKRASR